MSTRTQDALRNARGYLAEARQCLDRAISYAQIGKDDALANRVKSLRDQTISEQSGIDQKLGHHTG